MSTHTWQPPVSPGDLIAGSNCFRRNLAFARQHAGLLPAVISLRRRHLPVCGNADTGCSGACGLAFTALREPIVAVGLALFAWIAIRTLFVIALTPASLSAILQYHNLLIVPFLWAAFRLSGNRKLFLYTVTAGAMLVALIYWCGFILFEQMQPRCRLSLAAASAETRLLEFMGGAASLLDLPSHSARSLLFEHTRLAGRRRWLGYSAAAILMFTVIFPISGRTGHSTLLLLIACAGWRCAPALALGGSLSCAPLRRSLRLRCSLRRYKSGSRKPRSRYASTPRLPTWTTLPRAYA